MHTDKLFFIMYEMNWMKEEKKNVYANKFFFTHTHIRIEIEIENVCSTSLPLVVSLRSLIRHYVIIVQRCVCYSFHILFATLTVKCLCANYALKIHTRIISESIAKLQ